MRVLQRKPKPEAVGVPGVDTPLNIPRPDVELSTCCEIPGPRLYAKINGRWTYVEWAYVGDTINTKARDAIKCENCGKLLDAQTPSRAYTWGLFDYLDQILMNRFAAHKAAKKPA